MGGMEDGGTVAPEKKTKIFGIRLTLATLFFVLLALKLQEFLRKMESLWLGK